VYEHQYAHPTTFVELETIRNQAPANSVILVGGYKSDKPDDIIVCSIDDTKEVLTETFSTSEAKATSSGNYFYFKKSSSFGFAPNAKISLSSADT